jgi:hypothetical protein
MLTSPRRPGELGAISPGYSYDISKKQWVYVMTPSRVNDNTQSSSTPSSSGQSSATLGDSVATPQAGDASFDMSSSNVSSSFSDVNSSYTETATPPRPVRSIVLGASKRSLDFSGINHIINGSNPRGEALGYTSFLRSPVSSKTGSALLSSDRSVNLACNEAIDSVKVLRETAAERFDITDRARQILRTTGPTEQLNSPEATIRAPTVTVSPSLDTQQSRSSNNQLPAFASQLLAAQ